MQKCKVHKGKNPLHFVLLNQLTYFENRALQLSKRSTNLIKSNVFFSVDHLDQMPIVGILSHTIGTTRKMSFGKNVLH